MEEGGLDGWMGGWEGVIRDEREALTHSSGPWSIRLARKTQPRAMAHRQAEGGGSGVSPGGSGVSPCIVASLACSPSEVVPC